MRCPVLPTIALIALATCANAARQTLAYTVTATAEPALHIVATFKGDADGSTTIALPNRWGGQPELFKGVRGLRTATPGASISDQTEPFLKVITHKPGEQLSFEYDLVQDAPGPRTGDTHYRPAIEATYFNCIGHGLWVRPAWGNEDSARVQIEIDWRLPEAWGLANSFGTGKRRQRFEATLDQLIHSIYTGGDFRVKSMEVEGKEVVAAFRGVWRFTDDGFADLVKRVIESGRAFWSDHSAPYFLVTMIPVGADPNSSFLGGTGLTNSFALFCSANTALTQLRITLAHEYFHNWNSPRLGRMEPPEAAVFWFSEGFTDYYARLLLLRSGLITLEEYIAEWNRMVREYYLSPARNEPNARIVKDFWNVRDLEKLPYQRGFLLASNWNARIVRNSGGKASLDNAMKEMFRAAGNKPPSLNADWINRFVQPHLGASIFADVNSQIERGELIVPDPDVLGPGAELHSVEVPVFEIGLDLETLRTKKEIAGVVEGSAAYLAGLRNGQFVVRRLPIHMGDPSKAVEITIKDGEGERTIRYLPVTAKGIQVPQVRLKEGTLERERTVRWLGVTR